MKINLSSLLAWKVFQREVTWRGKCRPSAKLILLFAILVVVDLLMTLAGQPVAYWRGHHEVAEELNPMFLVILRFGPEVAVFATTVVIILAVATCVMLGRTIGSLILTILIILHAIGAAGWMFKLIGGIPGFIIATGLLCFTNLILDHLDTQPKGN